MWLGSLKEATIQDTGMPYIACYALDCANDYRMVVTVAVRLRALACILMCGHLVNATNVCG